MPIPPRTLAPGTLVTCESDTCTPRGVMPDPHTISASCSHPRRVVRTPVKQTPTAAPTPIVACDAHGLLGARFALHHQLATCVNPISVGGES